MHRMRRNSEPTKAAKAAAQVRQAMRRAGVDPKGRVSVQKTCYTTEVDVDLRGIRDVERESIEDAVNAIDYSPEYSWNIW